jgi:hypothetical protein
MTADNKALPEFRMRECGPLLSLLVRARSWPENSNADANEDHIAAVLAAMDPERRARVLGPYLPEGAAVAHRLLELAERVTERDVEALAAERAKVAGLKHAIDDMGATLAKVEAERDGLHAFLRQHGSGLSNSARVGLFKVLDGRPYHEAAAAVDALDAILATLPKGTTES